MTQSRSMALMLALGAMGAAVAAIALLAMDGAPDGYAALVNEDLPALIVAAVIGFLGGMLVALLWSGLQRYFAPSLPPG